MKKEIKEPCGSCFCHIDFKELPIFACCVWCMKFHYPQELQEEKQPYPSYKAVFERKKQAVAIERGEVGCEAVGYKIACKGIICWAHIIPRRYKPLKNSAKNRVWVCKAHEIYFNVQGKREWDVFVMARFPERWDFIVDKYNHIEEKSRRPI